MTEAEKEELIETADVVANGIMKPFLDMAHGRDVEEIAREAQARQAGVRGASGSTGACGADPRTEHYEWRRNGSFAEVYRVMMF